MAKPELSVITGAFSFTGKYIARLLLALGQPVKTLTGHPHREHPFGKAIPAAPFHFEDPQALAASITGAGTLYNTYWIRFEHGRMTFAKAIAHTAALLVAARQAGVRRIVHVSTVHADEASPHPCYRAKAEAERLVRESGLSYAILRPTVLFGNESILFNNIAWMLRKFPAFAVAGKGDYQLQPLYVGDLAELAVNIAPKEQSIVLDAAGPETFSFDEMLRFIAGEVGSHARLLHVDPERALQLTRMLGSLVGDIVLTREEIDALMQGLMVATGAPNGHTLFSSWFKRHAAEVGVRYCSEIERHYH